MASKVSYLLTNHGTLLQDSDLPTSDKLVAVHNSIYRGQNITSKLSTIMQNIQNGYFDDVFIGDYFTFTANSKTYTARIAAFNPYKGLYAGNGGSSNEYTNKDHALVVIDNVETHAMQSTTTTSGFYTENGYYNSEMHTWLNSTFYDYLPSNIRSMILPMYDFMSIKSSNTLSNPTSPGLTGCATSRSLYQYKLRLMTECMVFGNHKFGNVYDDSYINWQLPLFKLNSDMINPKRSWYWLSDVASASSFAGVTNNGIAYYTYANNPTGVRPLMCIG